MTRHSFHDYYSAYRSQGMNHDEARRRASLDEYSPPRLEPWVSAGHGVIQTLDQWKAEGRKNAK